MDPQKQAAKKAMISWLANEHELGKAPLQIKCVNEFDLYDLHYYIFKFKKDLFSEWLVGVCGGYEANGLEHCGHIYSEMKKYDPNTSIDSSKQMIEDIRIYWMKQAEQSKIQECFKANLNYISQTEMNANDIERQFVKTQERYFVMVGEVDCPTGNLVVADPLCYLYSNKHCPQLSISIPKGTYPVLVSICRTEGIGIRMCTAKLKLKDTGAVAYKIAMPTEDTAAAKGKDGVISGFPVDAGMMSFCDVQVAEEYRTFLGEWHKEHPEGNHYDDYFAEHFALSYEKSPEYQREGGDFIEWSNPSTSHKMVMIASGFGDGFYQSYWGYDDANEICELIVPMVNPDIFC